MTTPTNPAWSVLKPVGELVTKLLPCNRWGMIYSKKGNNGWRCLACMMDFDLASAARRHHCSWETRWRSWCGREAPSSDTCATHLEPIKEVKGLVEGIDKALVKERSKWDRFFSFLRG